MSRRLHNHQTVCFQVLVNHYFLMIQFSNKLQPQTSFIIFVTIGCISRKSTIFSTTLVLWVIPCVAFCITFSCTSFIGAWINPRLIIGSFNQTISYDIYFTLPKSVFLLLLDYNTVGRISPVTIVIPSLNVHFLSKTECF